MLSPRVLRQAPYALRVTQRKGGRAAVVYRRQADSQGRDRLQRVAALAPLAFTAATPMLRDAVLAALKAASENLPSGRNDVLSPGPYRPLDADWGPRVACYAVIAAGLRDGERLLLAAENLRHANPDQAAWWLGLLLQQDNVRALRALRILTEAVQT